MEKLSNYIELIYNKKQTPGHSDLYCGKACESIDTSFIGRCVRLALEAR
jgi:hypothetical protein